MFSNRFIRRHQARARIHHKQYDVRFFNRQQRLFRHAGFYTVFCAINPAGINADKLTAFNFADRTWSRVRTGKSATSGTLGCELDG